MVKIWQLFGWFYFSLAILLGLYFFRPAIRRWLFPGVLSAVVFVNVFWGGKFLRGQLGNRGEIFTGSQNIIAKTTFGESEFAKALRAKLPLTASGCVFWRNDVPTVYLISELYPRKFRPMEADDSLAGCNYAISPESSRPELGVPLLSGTNGSAIYLLKK